MQALAHLDTRNFLPAHGREGRHTLRLKLSDWSLGGVTGIPGVTVKCIDIRRNTRGEGGLLDQN